MPKIPNLTAQLRQLSVLDSTKKRLSAGSSGTGTLHLQIETLREKLPTALLTHYDQRRARGKPAIAAVKRGVCGACHLSLSRGRASDMQSDGGALQVCENCGVFIYLDDSVPASSETADEAPARPTPKARKKAAKKSK